MSDPRQQNRLDRDLWRRFSDAAPKAKKPGEIDPNLLAAYLDGTASEKEGEEVEHAMLADPSVLDMVRELREIGAAAPVVVPETVKAQARALVPSEIAPRRKVFRGRWADAVQWLAAAAAILAVSAWGYWLGQNTSAMQTQTASLVPTSLSLEVEETNESAAIFDVNGGNGGGGVL